MTDRSMRAAALPCPVIFDLDGTLIDSVPDLAAAINRLLVSEGMTEMQHAQVASYVGNGAPTLVRLVMEARGIDLAHHAEWTARMVADYSARSGELTTLYPGVRDALVALSARGHALGLCTNKPLVATTAVLDHFGLTELFGVVIAGDSLPRRKPDAAPLWAAVNALGRPEGDPAAIYVGDSVVDAVTALNASLPFVLFTEGYLNGDPEKLRMSASFGDFSDLPGIIARLTSAV